MLPHGFADLDQAVVKPSPPAAAAAGTAGSSGRAPTGGVGGAAAAAAAAGMQDPKMDVTFSPLEAVMEHLRGKRVTSPVEITEAIVDGLSDVRKDVQAVASGLIEWVIWARTVFLFFCFLMFCRPLNRLVRRVWACRKLACQSLVSCFLLLVFFF